MEESKQGNTRDRAENAKQAKKPNWQVMWRKSKGEEARRIGGMKWEPGAFVQARVLRSKGAGNDCRVVDWGESKESVRQGTEARERGACHFRAPVREVRERPEKR